jgi:eukaryotic-like serine/threonine-protein kinase
VKENERPTLELVVPPDDADYPRTFGSYLLLQPLAKGGMGEVFLAKHGGIAGIEKHCVLKTLRPQFTDDREYVSRFVDEARVVVQLSHKNICQVFDVGTVDGRYYLAMEYISGRDLRTVGAALVERTGQGLDLPLSLHVISEILQALDYAHRHLDPGTGEPLRLVHRDVSPQNVMISFEGEVKLIDFGLAASSLKLERTAPNVVMGKIAYMPPEQVRGDPVDARADIFAVGVMLYELLSGERFYDNKTPYEIWALAAAGNWRPAGWARLDEQLREIVDRSLSGDPAKRYPTCHAMLEDIEAYRAERSLRGSTPALRALVDRVMGVEISEARKQLAKFRNVKLLRPSAPREDSLASHEATERSDAAPVDSGGHTGTVPIARAARAHQPARAGSRTGLVIAASLSAVLLAAVLVLLGMNLGRRDGEGEPRAPIARVETPPHEAPAPAAHEAPPPVSPTPVSPIPVSPAPVAASPAPAPPIAAVPEPVASPTPTPAPATKKPRPAPRPTPTATATPAPTPAPAAAEPVTSLDWLRHFERKCPSLACTKAFAQASRDLVTKATDAEFKASYRKLRDECKAACPY